MSMPRAATSVATRKRSRPSRVAVMTFSRSRCGRSPLSQSASKPAAVSAPATCSVSERRLQKMIALSGSSTSSTCTRSPARSLPLTMYTKWLTDSAPTASLDSETMCGSRMCFSA
jgi:hypothetical protein